MANHSAPFIRSVLRTIPRRDLDDLAKAYLGVERPHLTGRGALMERCEAGNSAEFAAALGNFVLRELQREAPAA